MPMAFIDTILSRSYIRQNGLSNDINENTRPVKAPILVIQTQSLAETWIKIDHSSENAGIIDNQKSTGIYSIKLDGCIENDPTKRHE